MATPKQHRTTSLRDHSDNRMEGTGGWDDTIDWLKVEEYHSLSRSVSHHQNRYKCLLDSETVIDQGHGVVLINTDEAGTLVVTNFRLIFMSEGTENVIALGTIPLATIEKFSKMAEKNQPAPRPSEKSPSQRLLQVIGKDMRIIVFGFRPKTKQRHRIFEALLKCKKPSRFWDLYAFASGPSRFSSVNPKLRLINEYFRLLGKGFHSASMDMIENGSYTLSNDLWRISDINCNYTMCQTYPFALIVPKSISDVELLQASTFRAKCRLPVITWCHPGTGAILARSSQPLIGLMGHVRSDSDEKLVAALCTLLGGAKGRRKLYIGDARPRNNAIANKATGGGSESSSNYFQSEVVFFGIDNIHAMRESLTRLRDYVDTHGTTSSDGMSSFLRQSSRSWAGGNMSSMSTSVSTLGETGWLIHVQNILVGSAWIAARVALESASVLVHCSDGWDRTTQLVSLANMLLDPYYRTFVGFQALIEKDWLAFGHPFADRLGILPVSGSGNSPFELSRQSSSGNFSPSAGRHSSQTQISSHSQNNSSPIFLQWVDCVSQLMRIYPIAFEFSLAFLVDLLDCVLSCRFGNFFCNSEKERQQIGVSEACGCLWAYLDDLRSSERSHAHYNLFYDAQKHDGPLLPSAAALAPTLWPQFHLRWACPVEAESGVDARVRHMSTKLYELQKEKEAAERKAREDSIAKDELATELQKQKQRNIDMAASAEKARRESAVLRRAIQSLGCKVHFTTNGDTTVDVESNQLGVSNQSLYSSSRREFNSAMSHDEKSDLSVSITIAADDAVSNNPMSRICETLCPLRTRDGGCRWPEAGCAQLSSQFVGLKANYDAMERLLIFDSYFDAE